MNIDRLEASMREINEFGGTPEGGITRLAYTAEHWAATRYFMKQCEQQGMSVRIDACGNVIARRPGLVSNLPAVACGSHLDTVQQGGRFDGTLGVMAGLELVRSLNERGIATRHPIEVISFACEESARFGVSTVGSKAMAGKLNRASLEQLHDKEGVSFEEALSAVGLDVNRIESSRRSGKEFKAFFELHIEQGPVLEESGIDVGIVAGIAAPARLEITIQGRASHSGTTPMTMRKDALIGAAEIILELERAALAESSSGTVATAGVCDVRPGAMNVVPDQVMLQVDVRGTKKSSRQAVIERIYGVMSRLELERGLRSEVRVLSDEEPVLLDNRTADLLAEQCERLGVSHVRMMSGAGHDAMNMAALCPTGMIFVPSKGGLSHHKDEYSATSQIARGAFLLEAAVLKCAEAVSDESKDAIITLNRGHQHESGKAKGIV